jgi:hypothetical protein
MNAAIAQHLNITEQAIVRIEEWANVMFVVAKGLGARFVSKKIGAKRMEKITLEKAQEISQDTEAIKRGYVSEIVIDAAYEVVQILRKNGFGKSQIANGTIDYPNVFEILEPIQNQFKTRQWTSIGKIAAYLMELA